MHTARLFIPRRNHGTTRVDAKQLFYVLSVCQAEDSDSGSDSRFSHHLHLSCSLALCALYASSFCQASFCGTGVGPGTSTGLRFLFFNSLDNTIRWNFCLLTTSSWLFSLPRDWPLWRHGEIAPLKNCVLLSQGDSGKADGGGDSTDWINRNWQGRDAREPVFAQSLARVMQTFPLHIFRHAIHAAAISACFSDHFLLTCGILLSIYL